VPGEIKYVCKERHREDITDRVIAAAAEIGIFQLEGDGGGEPRYIVVECSKGHANRVPVWSA
jgi:hypothetical protein